MALLDPELFSDQIAKAVFDLAVPGDGSLLAGFGIDVKVMSCAVTIQAATLPGQLPDELMTLQTSTSISLR
jgi:hypothetical protein